MNYDNLDWMDDLTLRVKPPSRPRTFSPKTKAYLALCMIAVSFGVLAATGWF